MGDAIKAKNLAANLKGLDTSKVEVDDDQGTPAFAANSPEEAECFAKLEAALAEAGDTTVLAASKDLKLMCLRGRKYDVEKTTKLIPDFVALHKELTDHVDKDQLKADLQSHKLVTTGGKDAVGRAIIWIRLRYHDPKVSKAEDMGRLVATVMLNALKDVETQRLGVCIIQDMNGIGLKKCAQGARSTRACIPPRPKPLAPPLMLSLASRILRTAWILRRSRRSWERSSLGFQSA
jgi:hypothetical protein